MIITTEPSKGGKLAVYIDGEYLLTVDPDTWYSLDYSNGDEITPEELEKFRFIVSSRLAYAQALRFLTLRAHSASELYKKIIKKHSPEAAEFAVGRCRELGFIDDADFAERYAQELAEKKHYGASRIRNELFLKGIDREIIDNTLSSLEFDTENAIIGIIEKKYSGCLSDEKGRRRMIAGLVRLGYSYSDIKSALSELNLSEDLHDEY